MCTAPWNNSCEALNINDMFQESREEGRKGIRGVIRSTRGSKCLTSNEHIIISCNHFSLIDKLLKEKNRM